MNVIKTNNFNLKKILENFFNYFSNNFKLTLIIISFLLSVIVSLVVWTKDDSYQMLYNNLSYEDGGAIISQLTQMNIPYRFSENSGLLLVPKDKIYELRFKLSEQGLPKGIGVGLELFDKNKFGMSQLSEQVNYQRALEGELARSILRINIVKDVKIHLAFPKESLFLNEKTGPSASIILTLYPGRILDAAQVNSIVHFVSSSISGLTTKKVTIIDQFGQMLTNQSQNSNVSNNSQLKYTKLVESYFKSRIEQILAPLLGIENIHCQVIAKINFNSEETNENQYKPNFFYKNNLIKFQKSNDNLKTKKNDSEVHLNSSHTSDNINLKEYNSSLNNSKHQNISFLGNKTSLNTLTPDLNNLNVENNSTENHGFNHIFRHMKTQPGKIENISVSIILNHRINNNGKVIILNKNILQHIKNMISKAIHYSRNRGDVIQVVDSLFLNPIEDTLKDTDHFFSKYYTNNKLIGFYYIMIPCLIFLMIFNQIKLIKNNNKLSSIKKNIIDDKKNKNNINSLEKSTENSKNSISEDDNLSQINKKNMDSNFKSKISQSKIIATVIKKWINGDKS